MIAAVLAVLVALSAPQTVRAAPAGGTTARLFVDEGRLELRGGGLAGAVVWWRIGGGDWTAETCPTSTDPAAICAIGVAVEKARLALGSAPVEVLRLPPGFPAPTGAAPPEPRPSETTPAPATPGEQDAPAAPGHGEQDAPAAPAHGEQDATAAPGQSETKTTAAPGPSEREATAAPVPPGELLVPVSTLVVDAPLVRASSIDAWREQVVLPLAAPGIVASVTCRPSSCWLSDDGSSVVVVPPASAGSVTVRANLREGVAVQQPDGPVTSTTSVSLPVARCELRPLAPSVLAGTEDHLLPLSLGERCPTDLGELAVETTPPSAAYLERVASDGHRADVRLGHVPRVDSMELRLVRASTRAVVGSVRLDVRGRYAPIQVQLVDPEVGELSVIPTNREVRLEWASSDPKVGADLVPVALPGYYTVRRQEGQTYIRGLTRTVGEIPLVFGYEPAGSAVGAPLATFETQVHYAVRPVSIPVSLAADDARTGRLFAMFCRDGKLGDREIRPGDLVSLPFAARGGCHLRVDHRVLAPEDGTQRIRVTVAVTSPSGVQRRGGFSRVLSVSAGSDVDAVWLGDSSAMSPFDHISVELAHDDERGHYVGSGGAAGLPSRRYEVVFGDGRLRLYGSATVPTGLYRVTRGEKGGVLQFNAGVVARLAFLDREGHEYPLDLELGLLGTDLSGTPALSIVVGPGITVPLLNPQQAAQAAIGIHAWLEIAPGRTGPGQSPFAFIFGPSISLGDFGTNL